MRKTLLTATVTFFAIGAIGGAAQAANPNVPSWSPYAIMDIPVAGTPAPATQGSAMIAGQAAYVGSPNAPGAPGVPRDLQNSDRLSLDPDECNNGCAVSNGG